MSTRKYLAPVGSVSGTVMVNIGRYQRENLNTVFEMLGGVEALAAWAEENKSEFYTKLYPRLIPKETEVSTSEGVDALIRRLDAGEHAPVIGATYALEESGDSEKDHSDD